MAVRDRSDLVPAPNKIPFKSMIWRVFRSGAAKRRSGHCVVRWDGMWRVERDADDSRPTRLADEGYSLIWSRPKPGANWLSQRASPDPDGRRNFLPSDPIERKSTRLNSSHKSANLLPSSA